MMMSIKPTADDAELHARAKAYIDKVAQQVVESDIQNPTFTSVGDASWHDKGEAYRAKKGSGKKASPEMEALSNEGALLRSALEARCSDMTQLSKADQETFRKVVLTKEENEALMIKLAIPKGKALNDDATWALSYARDIALCDKKLGFIEKIEQHNKPSKPKARG